MDSTYPTCDAALINKLSDDGAFSSRIFLESDVDRKRDFIQHRTTFNATPVTIRVVFVFVSKGQIYKNKLKSKTCTMHISFHFDSRYTAGIVYFNVSITVTRFAKHHFNLTDFPR